MQEWPNHKETPLHPLDGVARAIGVGSIFCKDESSRFGLGSFKALGGAYAVFHLLRRHLQGDNVGVSQHALVPGEFSSRLKGIRVCAATAGNHGRSVAWGAQRFGCDCTIYIPAGTDGTRAAAIAALGAEVVRVAGGYDHAVRRAATDAATNGWWVVSDTAYSGYTKIPLIVMQGYGVMAEEIVRRWQDPEPPTHVFLQCGVGGLAASVCAHFWGRWGTKRPRCIVVEPEQACCMQLTARAGVPTAVEGSLDTTMSCLACAEVSLSAWDVLDRGADDYLLITDPEAAAAVTLLGEGSHGDPPLQTQPSGAGGLAGLLVASRDPELRDVLDLGPESRVLVIMSEGAAADATIAGNGNSGKDPRGQPREASSPPEARRGGPR